MSSPSFEEFLLDFLLDFNEDFSCFGRNIKQNRGKTQSSSWKVVMVHGLGRGVLCLLAHKQLSRRLEAQWPALGSSLTLIHGVTIDRQGKWMWEEGRWGQDKGKRGRNV